MLNHIRVVRSALQPLLPIRYVLPITLFLLYSCAQSQQPLTIAAASSLRFAVADVAEAFTLQTGVPVELVFSSSGKLTAQIQAGAAYDLFLAADDLYPQELERAGYTAAKPFLYARGQLALWTTIADVPLSADSLGAVRIRKIALPNPKVAPYGRAAMAYLQSHDLYERNSSKLVYGESVGQANQFVYSGAAEIGFTALSTVQRAEDFYRYDTLADAPPIIHKGVVISTTAHRNSAERFQAFLLSPAGQQILVRNGYLAVE